MESPPDYNFVMEIDLKDLPSYHDVVKEDYNLYPDIPIRRASNIDIAAVDKESEANWTVWQV